MSLWEPSRACLAVRIRKGTESGLHYYPSWFRLAKCCQYGVWLETGCMCQRLMRVQRQKVPTWHICQKSKMRMKNGRRSSFTVWLKAADDMLRGKTLYPWRDKNVWQLEIDYASTNIYPMLNLVLKFSNGLDCSPTIRNNMKNDCPGVKWRKNLITWRFSRPWICWGPRSEMWTKLNQRLVIQIALWRMSDFF